MIYGNAPTLIKSIEVNSDELMFVQYLPIKMKGSTDVRIPDNLLIFSEIITEVMKEVQLDEYVYITAKHFYVNADSLGNRAGWHSDGFGTPDINYIWSDNSPTEFCVQPFSISSDCLVSMQEMEEQAKKENVLTYPCNSLLRLDSSVIHRVNPKPDEGFRTFVKVSISQEKYNLIGNAHNPLFDYNWDMQKRKPYRNHPSV